IADVDRRSGGLRVDPVAPREPLPEARSERGCARGLDGGEPWHARDETPVAGLTQRLAEGGRVAEVAGRQHDPLRRAPVELLQQLEHDRLLSLDPEGIDGVDQVETKLRAGLLGELETVIEVAAHEQGPCTVGERLGQLAERDLPSRDHDQGPQPGATQTGAGVVDLQEALARGAAQLRVGLGELVAAARAALPRTAHALASFSTSFRIPPAVTAGPAPGPVITSGFFRYRMVVKINWLSVPLSEAIGLDASTTTSPTRMRRRVTMAR